MIVFKVIGVALTYFSVFGIIKGSKLCKALAPGSAGLANLLWGIGGEQKMVEISLVLIAISLVWFLVIYLQYRQRRKALKEKGADSAEEYSFAKELCDALKEPMCGFHFNVGK